MECPLFFTFLYYRLVPHLLQRSSQLVWTTGGFVAASDALQTGDDFLGFHAAHKRADALGITVATAYKLNLFHFSVVVHADADKLGAGAVGLVRHFLQLVLIVVCYHKSLYFFVETVNFCSWHI